MGLALFSENVSVEYSHIHKYGGFLIFDVRNILFSEGSFQICSRTSFTARSDISKGRIDKSNLLLDCSNKREWTEGNLPLLAIPVCGRLTNILGLHCDLRHLSHVDKTNARPINADIGPQLTFIRFLGMLPSIAGHPPEQPSRNEQQRRKQGDRVLPYQTKVALSGPPSPADGPTARLGLILFGLFFCYCAFGLRAQDHKGFSCIAILLAAICWLLAVAPP